MTSRFAREAGPGPVTGRRQRESSQTESPILNLTLSHDAEGDLCQALLRPVLRIDLQPLHRVLAPRRSATLRLYRPGAAAPSFDLAYTF